MGANNVEQTSTINNNNHLIFIGGDDDDELMQDFNKIDSSINILNNYSKSNNFKEYRLVDSDDITLDSDREDKFYSTPFEQYNLQKLIKRTKTSEKSNPIELEDVDCSIPSRDDPYFEPPSFKSKSDQLVLERVNEWMHYLRCDNNLLFFGLGSKILPLNQLMYCLKERDVNSYFVIVCGYNQEVTIGTILDEILKMHLKSIKNLKSHVEKVDTIIKIMNQRNEKPSTAAANEEFGDFADFMEEKPTTLEQPKAQHLYICIHNMDGAGLRSKSTQLLLSVLASNRYIHLIGSVDNQLSNLLWEPSIEDKFGFVRFNITNFCTYFCESEHYSLHELYNDDDGGDGETTTKRKSGSSSGGADSESSKTTTTQGPVEIVANILKSANKKHRQIYMIICEKFIENEKHNESAASSTQPSTTKSSSSSGCTHQEIKSSMGAYSTDDALLRDGLSYLENQIKVIKKKQNTYIPTLKRNQCEKLISILNNNNNKKV